MKPEGGGPLASPTKAGPRTHADLRWIFCSGEGAPMNHPSMPPPPHRQTGRKEGGVEGPTMGPTDGGGLACLYCPEVSDTVIFSV